MSTQSPDSSDQSARGIAGQRGKTEREVICKICEAVYVPSATHKRLASSPQAVLESAFMGMCHFCFRCRRPACPSCWDDVHDVCGACSLDAQLPFRTSVPSLDGVTFPPPGHSQLVRVRTVTPPLVCVRPGRFQHAPLPIEAQTTLYLQTISDQPLSDASQSPLLQKMPLPSSEPQQHVLENTHSITPEIPSSLPLRSPAAKSLADTEERAKRPDRREVPEERGGPIAKAKAVKDVADMAKRPDRREVPEERRGPIAKAKTVVDVADMATRPGKRRVNSQNINRKATIRRAKPGHIATEIVVFIVLLIVMFVGSALLFPSVNDGLVYILHVDIRAEIAYLLQLIRHLF